MKDETVQPENTRKRTESHACDCIERQAAIDAVLRAEALVRAYGYRYAVDARCRDCKHKYGSCCDTFAGVCVAENDFCSRAERREVSE